jgi:hypothetical protein
MLGRGKPAGYIPPGDVDYFGRCHLHRLVAYKLSLVSVFSWLVERILSISFIPLSFLLVGVELFFTVSVV